MLETVTAHRFGGIAQGGATEPAMMGCLNSRNEELDVYVKFSSNNCPSGGLVRDLIGCLVAKFLGLRAGIPVLVDVPRDLIDAIRPVSPSSSSRMQQSVSPAFGSISLGSGYQLFQRPVPSSYSIRDQIVEMWAFDQLIMNPDRSDVKPNCLIKGENLALIDHEKSLSIAGLGFLFFPPWDHRWTPNFRHLVHETIRGGALPLARIKDAWSRLDEANLSGICAQVPRTWDQEITKEIKAYLSDLHSNLDQAFINIEKAMT